MSRQTDSFITHLVNKAFNRQNLQSDSQLFLLQFPPRVINERIWDVGEDFIVLFYMRETIQKKHGRADFIE